MAVGQCQMVFVCIHSTLYIIQYTIYDLVASVVTKITKTFNVHAYTRIQFCYYYGAHERKTFIPNRLLSSGKFNRSRIK